MIRIEKWFIFFLFVSDRVPSLYHRRGNYTRFKLKELRRDKHRQILFNA